PKSVIYNWEQEIIKWDCDNVVIVDGTAEQRKELLKEESKYKIINYAMLRKGKYPILFDTKWDVILFDEAHRLKNRKTQQAKGAERLEADYISMLTGSPIPNHPHELWHLLHILYPRRFRSYWRFVDRFCVTQDNFFSPVPDIVGVKNEERLKEILVPIMIRNKKEDVLTELPPKTYKAIELDMLPEQQRIYNEMEEDMVAWIDGEPKKVANDLGKMIRLQQIALSPALIDGPDKSAKTTALLDLLEDTTGKVVVFSWFKGYIKLLEETLKNKGYGVATVHGEKSTKARGEAQNKFWNDENVKVFLGTIGAAGEGVNLQCASTLVFMDKSWVPSDNRQAEDRIHRKGQKGNATIISLVARNSIDVDKELALSNKERIINKVMSMEKTAENLLQRIKSSK
ncbi:MAG: DEAD/DEAH box helicase, partial [Halanaerobiales bacterium]